MRRLAWFVALALLSGCPGKDPVRPTSSKVPSPAPVASPTATPPVLASPTTGPLATPTPAPSVAPAAIASLTGIVRIPVYIVSTSGSGIVSNNGAAVISNNGAGIVSTSGSGIVSTSGSGYRLAATPDQLPLAGAKVTVTTAAGTKVAEATTDAKGQYAITTPIDPHNMLVKVELPNDLGTLAAIAPKAAKTADVDLVSSLTTTYILDRYVATQPTLDAVTILDKLPADVEATTRTAAATALTVGPDRLTPEKVVAAVNSLRQANAALDQQLEVVKKLLVAVGLSDLGAGSPATQAAFSGIGDLALAADNSLLIGELHRIWRLAPDGTLQTVMGNGSTSEIFEMPVDGFKGPDVGLRRLFRFVPGPKGDMLAYNGEGEYASPYVVHLGVDGIAHHAYWTGPAPELADVAFTAAGEMLGMTADATFYALKDKAAFSQATDKLAAPAFKVPGPAVGWMSGRDAAGNLYVCDGVAVFRYDPATKKSTSVFQRPAGSSQDVLMDHRGNAFYRDAAGKPMAHTAEGAELPLPTSAITGKPGRFALTPDGVAYLATDAKVVWRLGGGTATIVAGGGTLVDGQQAGNTAITALTGVAPMPNGDLVVVNGHQVQRVAADGTLTVIAGVAGSTASSGDGGDPLKATFLGPRIARADGAGNLYLADNLYDSVDTVPIRKLSADFKQLTTVFTPKWVADMVVAVDGTIYWADQDATYHYLIKRRKPDGTIETVTTDFFGRPMLAWMPSGELAIWPQASGEGLAWKDGVTRKLTMYVYDEQHPSPRHAGDRPGNMAVDARGRFYFADSVLNALYRWDPAGDQWEKLAGGGARLLNGTGVDSSLNQPSYLAFGANGDLYIGDVGHKQVKRLAKADLQ